MAECRTCGSSVSETYLGVFAPEAVDGPRVCPRCAGGTDGGTDVDGGAAGDVRHASDGTRRDRFAERVSVARSTRR